MDTLIVPLSHDRSCCSPTPPRPPPPAQHQQQQQQQLDDDTDDLHLQRPPPTPLTPPLASASIGDDTDDISSSSSAVLISSAAALPAAPPSTADGAADEHQQMIQLISSSVPDAHGLLSPLPPVVAPTTTHPAAAFDRLRTDGLAISAPPFGDTLLLGSTKLSSLSLACRMSSSSVVSCPDDELGMPSFLTLNPVASPTMMNASTPTLSDRSLHLEQLPAEVMVSVCVYLPTRNMWRLASTNWAWRKLIRANCTSAAFMALHLRAASSLRASLRPIRIRRPLLPPQCNLVPSDTHPSSSVSHSNGTDNSPASSSSTTTPISTAQSSPAAQQSKVRATTQQLPSPPVLLQHVDLITSPAAIDHLPRSHLADIIRLRGLKHPVLSRWWPKRSVTFLNVEQPAVIVNISTHCPFNDRHLLLLDALRDALCPSDVLPPHLAKKVAKDSMAVEMANQVLLGAAATKGQYEVFARLIGCPGIVASYAQDAFLGVAARFGNLEIVRLLVTAAGDPEVLHRVPSLEGESSLVAPVDPSNNDNYALIVASQKGHLDVVKYLLSLPPIYGVDPKADFNSPLRSASEFGHIDVLELLLTQPLVNPADKDNTAIAFACENGHVNVVRRLLATGRVNPAANDDLALRLACENSHPEVVRTLLEYSEALPQNLRNRAVNPATNEDYPLRMACHTGCGEIVRLLLATGRVNPSVKRDICLLHAATVGHAGIVRMLLATGKCNIAADDYAALREAALGGHADVVEALLAGGDDGAVNGPICRPLSTACHTAMLLAASNGHVGTVKRLMTLGVPPGACDGIALKVAAENGHLDVVELLLSMREVNPDVERGCAVVMAAQNGHVGIVRALRQSGLMSGGAMHRAAAAAVMEGNIELSLELMRCEEVDPRLMLADLAELGVF